MAIKIFDSGDKKFFFGLLDSILVSKLYNLILLGF